MTFANNFASKILSRFNPAMLSLAREAMGFSQKQLASILKCAQTRISKLEAGSLVPTEQDIQKLVVVLQQHREFFFQQEAATAASVSFYRKAQSLPLMMLRRCNAEM